MDEEKLNEAIECAGALVDTYMSHAVEEHDLLPEQTAKLLVTAVVECLVRQSDQRDKVFDFLHEGLHGLHEVMTNGSQTPNSRASAKREADLGASLARLRAKRIRALREGSEQIDRAATHHATGNA